MNKYAVLLFVVSLLFGGCTTITPQQQAQVRTLDSLLLVLNDFDGRLAAIDSSHSSLLNKKVEDHLANPQWQSNEAALASLITAQKYLNSFQSLKVELHTELTNSINSAEDLRQSVLNKKEDDASVIPQIAELNIRISRINDQTEYLLSRFYAQEMLVETLDKALKHD